MARLARILVTTLALALPLAGLWGCGQKGSLYLPDDPASAGRATLVQTLIPGTARAPASGASAPAPTHPPPPSPPDSIELQ